MKILYIDSFFGISAKAVLGALSDICPDENIKSEKTECEKIPCTYSETNINVFSKYSERVSDFAMSKCNLSSENIKDIKSCAYLLEKIKPTYIMSSKIYDGSGFCDGEPIPKIDVLKMAQENRIPISNIDIRRHLAKKDGLSLLIAISKEFGPMPEMEIESIGYGTDKNSIVRVILGHSKNDSLSDFFEIGAKCNKENFSYSCK